jgi:2-dehydro-3-deoxyphosphogluconate aldolase/(4S)-4-hydroxy-2-oxoglutarate aldolase
MDALARIEHIGLIPVIKIEDAADAAPLCRALADGGLPVAEITFRTPAAEEAIRRASAELPDVLVGAGTVLTVDQAARAIAAGAKYIVSPGLNPAVVGHCVERGVPVLPGCATPSDIEAALGFGLDTVKFFPAEALGGLKLIEAMSAPYGGISFVPTGGIGEKNAREYLAFPKVRAIGGSWMAPAEMIRARDWVGITARAKAAVALVIGLELEIVELPGARADAQQLEDLLGGVLRLGGARIALTTTNLKRAIYHLGLRGYAFEPARDGVAHMAGEIAGLAVELRER